MSEHLPGLPDPIAVPVFHPEGYDVSRTGARRRRRRQLALTGGGLVSLSTVLVGALLLQGPGGRQVLTPADRVPATPVARATSQGFEAPTPSPAASRPVPLPTAPRSTLAPLLPRSSASPRPSASASPPAQAARAIAGPAPTVTSFDATRQCTGSGPTSTQGYCSYYDGALTARRGTKPQLAASVCRLPGRGPGTLHTRSGEWASFVISTNDTGALWHWSTGKRFVPDSRTFQVAEGTCLRFAVSWDLRGDDGRPLGAGSYDLGAKPNVDARTGVVITNAEVEKFTIT